MFNQPFVQHFSWTTTFQKKKINFMRGVVNDTHKSFFYAKSLLQIETFAAVLDEAKMHHTSFEMQLIRNSIVCINLWKNLKFCLRVCTEMFLLQRYVYKQLGIIIIIGSNWNYLGFHIIMDIYWGALNVWMVPCQAMTKVWLFFHLGFILNWTFFCNLNTELEL